MMKKSVDHKKDRHPSKLTRPTLEQKMGSMGTLAGRAMEKVASAPGNIVHSATIVAQDVAHSATTVANETSKKASRAASKVAQDVATRLDPDEPTKD